MPVYNDFEHECMYTFICYVMLCYDYGLIYNDAAGDNDVNGAGADADTYHLLAPTPVSRWVSE